MNLINQIEKKLSQGMHVTAMFIAALLIIRYLIVTYFNCLGYDGYLLAIIIIGFATITWLQPVYGLLASVVGGIILNVIWIEFKLFNISAGFIPTFAALLVWIIRNIAKNPRINSSVVSALDGLIFMACIAFLYSVFTPSVENGIWILLTTSVDFYQSDFHFLVQCNSWICGLFLIRALISERYLGKISDKCVGIFCDVLFSVLLACLLLQVVFEIGHYGNQGLTSPFFGIHDLAAVYGCFSIWYLSKIFSSFKERHLLSTLFVVIAISITFITTSRTTITLLLFAIVFLGIGFRDALMCSIKSWSVRKTIFVLAGSTLVAAILFIYLPTSPNASRLNFENSQILADNITTTMSIRFSLWQAAIKLAIEQPVSGVGYGKFCLYAFPNFDETIQQYVQSALFLWDTHNLFFQLAVSIGFICIALFAWFLVNYIINLLRAIPCGSLTLSECGSLCFLMYIGSNVTNISINWPMSFLLVSVWASMPFKNSDTIRLLKPKYDVIVSISVVVLCLIYLLSVLLSLNQCPNFEYEKRGYGFFDGKNKFEGKNFVLNSLPVVLLPRSILDGKTSFSVSSSPYFVRRSPMILSIYKDDSLIRSATVTADESFSFDFKPDSLGQYNSIKIKTNIPFSSLPIRGWYQPTAINIQLIER